MGIQEGGEWKSPAADPEEGDGFLTGDDVQDLQTAATSNNPAEGTPDCVVMTVGDSTIRASAAYSSRTLRTPKPTKEDIRAQKKMRMTEVEKLKKENEKPKKHRSLRGSKEEAEKVADTKNKDSNISSQQNAKGKKKKNMPEPVSEHGIP